MASSRNGLMNDRDEEDLIGGKKEKAESYVTGKRRINLREKSKALPRHLFGARGGRAQAGTE